MGNIKSGKFCWTEASRLCFIDLKMASSSYFLMFIRLASDSGLPAVWHAPIAWNRLVGGGVEVSQIDSEFQVESERVPGGVFIRDADFREGYYP